VNWTSSLFTFVGIVQSSLAFTIAGSALWTMLLWGASRALTRGIYSRPSRVLLLLTSLFSIAALSYSIITGIPFYPYAFFFSALIITIFTDATTLLISRYVTLYAMPIGWLASNMGLLPITPLESIGGSFAGLLILTAVRFISKKLLGKDGLGQGDVDLLCFIGAFTGPAGCWITLMTASLLGSVFGLIYFIAAKGRRDILLPFGLFLGMGAILFVLFEEKLTALFLPIY
jgi:leader peptidase (prepilin peptidase)/N-methyltransferase